MGRAARQVAKKGEYKETYLAGIGARREERREEQSQSAHLRP